MRNFMWVVLSVAASTAAGWVVFGPWLAKNGFEIFIVMILFMGSPIGSYWMIYKSIRYEARPLPFIVLALIPLAFLWYYFERVRPGKHMTRTAAS